MWWSLPIPIGGHLSILLPIRWIGKYKTLRAIIKYEKEIRNTLNYFSRQKKTRNIVNAIGLNAIFNKNLLLTAVLMFSILDIFKPADNILKTEIRL